MLIPAWKLPADNYPLKLQCLQNNVLRTTRFIDLDTAFSLPHVYDYITNLWRQQAEAIKNQENTSIYFSSIGQGDDKNIRGLNITVVKLTTVQMTTLPL